MIRTLRARTGTRTLRLASNIPPHVRAASSVPALQEDGNEDEPYGNDFGSGPSRIPYQPPEPITISTTQLSHLRTLRSRFRELNPGHYGGSRSVFKALGLPNGGVTDMSRAEIMTVVHHLIRENQSRLAAQILSLTLRDRRERSPREFFDIPRATIRAIGIAETPRTHITPSKSLRHRIDSILELIRELQYDRKERPLELYQAAMAMCIGEKRQDKAAALFVGLVEEWVTEGRVAEGADPNGFHPGGGPPIKTPSRTAKRHSAWWIGVRTWKLPGEVLSPHQRQDLWHPHNLSLGSRLVGFPFPLATSPPSLVPCPTSKLLQPLLSSLRLDPSLADPADFESSMRAMAILANAIHNRTLPCLSIRPLIDALQRTPYNPPVYPLNMPADIPEDQKWAYEATVHVHLALQSLMFSPPISSSSFAEAHAHEAVLSGDAPMRSLAQFYRLQPLQFSDCLSLVRYGLEKLQLPASLKRLVGWMARTFTLGAPKPAFWNMILRGASVAKGNRLANVADDVLFGDTALRRQNVDPEDVRDPRRPKVDREEEFERARLRGPDDTADLTPVRSSFYTPNDLSLILPRVHTQPLPNENSIIALVDHLGRSSQFDRLEEIVYQLIPFLAKTEEANPTALSPKLYVALLSALELAGKTGLAQRVYNLALQAEQGWIDSEIDAGSTPLDAEVAARLPIEVFTAMMASWANEVERSYPHAGRQAAWYRGWKVPARMRGLSRHEAATEMARQVYVHAHARWKDGLSRRSQPNEAFFDASLSALSWYWRFRFPEQPLSSNAKMTLYQTTRHIRAAGLDVPPAVEARAAGVRRGTTEGAAREGTLMPLPMTPKDWLMAKKKRHSENELVSFVAGGLEEERLRAVAEQMIQAEGEGLWREYGKQEERT